MTTFEGPPAAGKALSLSRSPVLLRVTLTQNSGEIDALDQLDDEPRDTERIFVYILDGNSSGCFIDGEDKDGKRWGHRHQMAHYKLFEHQPEDAVMRDNARWHEWCKSMAPTLGRKTFDPLTGKETVQ